MGTMDLEVCFQIDCGLIGEFHLCGNERAFIDNQTDLNCQSFFSKLTVPNIHLFLYALVLAGIHARHDWYTSHVLHHAVQAHNLHLRVALLNPVASRYYQLRNVFDVWHLGGMHIKPQIFKVFAQFVK